MSNERTFRFPVSDRAYASYLGLGSRLDGRVDKFNAIISFVLENAADAYFTLAQRYSGQKPYRFVSVRACQHSCIAKQCGQRGVFITRFLSTVLENLPEEFIKKLNKTE